MTTGQGYDRDLNLKGILGFSLGVLGAILVASAAMWYASVVLRDQLVGSDPEPSIIPEARQDYEPPGPRLQDDPEAELEALRADEEQVLTGYQWVDEGAGVARVPVERAMAILAADPTAVKTLFAVEPEAPPAQDEPEATVAEEDAE